MYSFLDIFIYIFSCICIMKSESEVTQSCPTLCDPTDCSLPGFSIHGIFPGKSTVVGCRFLRQGIFPTQGSNPGLPHCKQMLLPSEPGKSGRHLLVPSLKISFSDPILHPWSGLGFPPLSSRSTLSLFTSKSQLLLHWALVVLLF